MVAVLLATLAGALSKTAIKIENGFFYGRSAGVVVYPESPEVRDGVVLMKDDTSQIISESQMVSGIIQDIHFADLVTRSFGLPVVDVHSNVPEFIKGDFYVRPRANLFILADSLGQNSLAGASKIGTFFSGAHTASLKIEASSYPPSSLTDAVTLVSGSFPSKHGIVSPKWQTAHGDKVQAFTPDSPSSWNKVANVPDYFAQTFDGKSLIVSISGDEQIAAANGVSPLLALSHPEWQSNFVSSFNSKSLSFESLNSNLQITTAQLKTFLDDPLSVFGHLRQTGFQFALGDDSVDVSQGELKARFDLAEPAAARSLLELQLAYSLPTTLQATQADAVNDDVPDYLAVAFASNTGLSSVHRKVVVAMIDQVIPMVVARVSALYGGRLLTEAVLLGETPVLPTLASVLPFLSSSVQEHAEQFPSLYVPPADVAEVCRELSYRLESSTYRVWCPSSSMETRQQFFLQGALRSGLGNDTNTTTVVTTDQVARFQIVLWLSILMAFVTYAVIYNVACMSFKRDTLIFSSFNPNWEDRGARGGRR